MPLIAAESEALLWAVVIGIAAFGFWAEQHTRWGRFLTGVIVAMSLAMLLSNIKVIPAVAPVYDTIYASILPLAIPLLLFRADLRRVFRDGGPTLWAFCIGAITVVIGVFLAHWLVPLGEVAAVAGGLYSATYIGGSANFAAVAIATDFSEGSVLTAMSAADVIATNVQTMLLLLLPGMALMQRLFGVTVTAPADPAEQAEALKPYVLPRFDLAGASLALALAFALVAAGDGIAAWLEHPPLGILVTSALALLVSNFAKPLVARMSGDFEIGVFLIFLFLIAIAANADVWALLETGPIYFAYIAIVLTVHTGLLLLIAWLLRPLLKLDIRALVIASTACVGGISTASAIASAKGWRDLVVPGIMAGTLGYATGSFIGVWIWSVLG